MRVNANESWLTKENWRDFAEYEQTLDKTLSSRRMIVLCSYSLSNASAAKSWTWRIHTNSQSPNAMALGTLDSTWMSGTTPKDISEEDVSALLYASRQSKFPHRDYALTLFLADMSCRSGGLVALPLPDLDLEHARVLVTEKCRKSRFVFLSSQTISTLRDWLTVRQSSTEFVFVNMWGEQFTIWGVYQAFGNVAELAE